MPAAPTYCHRIPAALETLRQADTDWVDRRQLEHLLGVSKTVAWRLMRSCGAEPGPGNTLVCRRASLVAALEALSAEGGPMQREIARHSRLEQWLVRLRPEVRAQLTVVARDERALDLVSSHLASLPSNVTLTPTSLHIEFTDTDSLLEAVGTLIYALHNDLDRIRALLDQASGARRPELGT